MRAQMRYLKFKLFSGASTSADFCCNISLDLRSWLYGAENNDYDLLCSVAGIFVEGSEISINAGLNYEDIVQ